MNSATPEILIALDVGDKRVGVAVAHGAIVTPRDTFDRAQGEAEGKILELIAELGATTLVVGMPYGERGERNEQCEKVEAFCRRLERRTQISIVYVDEYASSAEARELLGITGKRASKQIRKGGMIDAQAASILLQSYINSRAQATASGD